jgi:hypothetical protein
MTEALMEDVVLARLGDGQPFAVQLVELEGPEPLDVGDRLTSPTGIRERAERGVTELCSLLAHIATEVGREIAAIPAEHRPAGVEAEVCLGMSAQFGPVWLAGKGDYTLKAKLSWKS